MEEPGLAREGGFHPPVADSASEEGQINTETTRHAQEQPGIETRTPTPSNEAINSPALSV